MDVPSLFAGLIAYAVSLFFAIVLVFLLYRLNTFLTNKTDEEQYLIARNRSVAVTLGSIVLSQAILLRHAVFPTMTVVREMFLRPFSWGSVSWTLFQCFLFFIVISVLSCSSVIIAVWFFTKMTGAIQEQEEIRKDNLAMAIFFSFVILSITLIVNEGLEDFSRSIIPYSTRGILTIP